MNKSVNKPVKVMTRRGLKHHLLFAFISLSVSVLMMGLMMVPVAGQDRLKSMPGYEQFQKMSREIPGSIKPGSLTVKWIDDGKAFEYTREGKSFRYDLATRTSTPTEGSGGPSTAPNGSAAPNGSGRRGGPMRGRQYDSAVSPDGTRKAFYRNRNLWLSNADGSGETPITTDGNEQTRIKYGSAS